MKDLKRVNGVMAQAMTAEVMVLALIVKAQV